MLISSAEAIIYKLEAASSSGSAFWGYFNGSLSLAHHTWTSLAAARRLRQDSALVTRHWDRKAENNLRLKPFKMDVRKFNSL